MIAWLNSRASLKVGAIFHMDLVSVLGEMYKEINGEGHIQFYIDQIFKCFNINTIGIACSDSGKPT